MNSIVKQIFREYEKDHLLAQKKYNERLEEIYFKIPRIKEIDDILNNTSLNFVKSILNKEKNVGNLIGNLEQNNIALIDEKKYLLNKNNYSENYLIEVYKCNLCKDTGYANNKKCHCFKQKLINKFYALSNLKNVLEYENFDNFDFRYYSSVEDKHKKKSPRKQIETIYQGAIQFVKNFDKNSDNLLLYGNSGLGKTFLCNCIAKDILDKGRTVLYVTAPEIFKIIENYRFNRDKLESPNEYVETIYLVDLLIIDDLGTEVSSIVTSSELFNIINSRILEKKHTILSTNIQINDFEQHYSQRLSSRIYGHYKLLNFFGEDIRIKKKHSVVKDF